MLVLSRRYLHIVSKRYSRKHQRTYRDTTEGNDVSADEAIADIRALPRDRFLGKQHCSIDQEWLTEVEAYQTEPRRYYRQYWPLQPLQCGYEERIRARASH